ncbi:MAG: prepilin peptidase [Campylobacterota bacterium]|nr:prepilin peptidase [Campylobacterota bacterium]
MEISISLIGLIFGSFFNMLIYRLPLGVSLLNPKRSICPNCNYQLKWYENIPLFSYLFLKGKCSNCSKEISIFYPTVELLTALVTLLLFIKIGLNIEFLITTLLFYILIILSFIDLRYKAVPDYLLIIVFICALFIPHFSFYNALVFAGGFVLLELFVTFYIQNIKSRILKDDSLKTQRAMGEGDIPIAAVIGGLLGIKLGIVAIFLASIFAIIPSLINSFIKKDIETPFIPYLSLGLFAVFVFDENIKNILGGIIQ